MEQVKKLRRIIENLERELNQAKAILRELENEGDKKSYKDVPGVEGTFDGVYMVSDTGEKYEVPANYAAKSRLIFGDRLKRLEENGVNVFKHIIKEPRLKLDGVLNKKEGKWYALTEKGTYRVSDTSVEFNGFKVNDRISVLIPENNLTSPYAAIESENKTKVEFVKQPVSQPAPRHEVKMDVIVKDTPRPSQPRHDAGSKDRPKRKKPSMNRDFKGPQNNKRDSRPQVSVQRAPEQVQPQASQGSQESVTRILDDEDLR